MRIFVAILFVFVFVFVEREACEKCSTFKSSPGNWFPSLGSWKAGIEIIKHAQNNLSFLDKEYWNLLMQCLQYNTQSTNNTSVHMVLMCPSIQSFNFPPPKGNPLVIELLKNGLFKLTPHWGGGNYSAKIPHPIFFLCKMQNQQPWLST